MSKGNPYFGATFAERKQARLEAEPKAVKADEVEDKAIAADETKAKPPRRRKAAARKRS